jgi:hypothetical protein
LAANSGHSPYLDTFPDGPYIWYRVFTSSSDPSGRGDPASRLMTKTSRFRAATSIAVLTFAFPGLLYGQTASKIRRIPAGVTVKAVTPGSVKLAPGADATATLEGAGLDSSGLTLKVLRKDGSTAKGQVTAELGKISGSSSRKMKIRAADGAPAGIYAVILETPGREISLPFQAEVIVAKTVPVSKAMRQAPVFEGAAATPPQPVTGTGADPKALSQVPGKRTAPSFSPAVPAASSQPFTVTAPAGIPAGSFAPLRRGKKAPEYAKPPSFDAASAPVTMTAPASLPTGTFGRMALKRAGEGKGAAAGVQPELPRADAPEIPPAALQPKTMMGLPGASGPAQRLYCPDEHANPVSLPAPPYDEEEGDCALIGRGDQIERWLAAVEAIAEACNARREGYWREVEYRYENLNAQLRALPDRPPSGLMCGSDSSSSPPGPLPGYPRDGWRYTFELKSLGEDVLHYCEMVDGLIEPLVSACHRINYFIECGGGVNDAARPMFQERLDDGMDRSRGAHERSVEFYNRSLLEFGWSHFREYFDESRICCDPDGCTDLAPLADPIGGTDESRRPMRMESPAPPPEED